MLRYLLFIPVILLAVSCKKEDISGDTKVLRTVSSLSEFESEIGAGVTLVFYHAVWCTKCAAQRPAVEALTKDDAIKAAAFLQVDYEKVKEVVTKYGVQGFPTIHIYKDNQLKHDLSGPGHTQAELTALVKALL